MRRTLKAFLFSLLLAAAAPVCAPAQEPSANAQSSSAFAEKFDVWRKATDPEQRIALGEELVQLAEGLDSKSFEAAGEHTLANIRFEVGTSYLARVRGSRPDNIEHAIGHFEAALKGWTRQSDPQDWARAHNNLAIAYMNRIRGDLSSNQELAIAHLEAPMEVFTAKDFPQEWGQIQNNLAIVLMGRLRGNREDNLAAAIERFEAALTVFKPDRDPYLWASAQHNLAAVYGARKRGNREEDREKQIAHVEAALTVFTREKHPHEWAQSQHNLAIAYVDRMRGDRGGNLEKAIAHFEAAASVLTREAAPDLWAQLQHNLAAAYSSLELGDQAANRRKAVAAYEAALTIFTREAYPHDHLRTSRLLGRTRLEAGDLQKAAEAFASARQAFLVLLGQGIEEADAKALLADAGPLFAEAAFTAAERGDPEMALELANEGRARLLTVAMKQQTLVLAPEQSQRLDAVRREIAVQRSTADAAQGEGRGEALKKLVELRKELLALVEAGGRDSADAGMTAARAIAATGGAVAVPVVTGMGGKVIILTANGSTSVDVPNLTVTRLSKLLVGDTDGKTGGWIAAYFVNYLDAADRKQRWPEWLAAIDGIGPELWDLVGARLDEALQAQNVRAGAHLVWLPTGWLGLLPLGLAHAPAGPRLADTYEISYTPSLEALAAARDLLAKAEAHPASPTLAVVINPTGDLPGTEKEGAIVASYFAPEARTLLVREAATPDAVLAALKGRSHWHFASHGGFAWSDARRSALIMHGNAPLTVERLLNALDLGRPRLVVLSACETGLSEITSNPDEFIGLPGTFTALGAAGVLGTLWPVSDAATALLVAKVYELHMEQDRSPSAALRQAQAWLRETSMRELEAYAQEAVARGRLEDRHVSEITQALRQGARSSGTVRSQTTRVASPTTTGAVDSEDAPPFAHPYYWAGFIHTGL